MNAERLKIYMSPEARLARFAERNAVTNDNDGPLFDRGRPPTAEERAQGTIWVLDEKSAEEVAVEKAAEAAVEAQQSKQRAAFLLELTELSRKYQLTIGGCGCCGSPYLKKLIKLGKYTIDGDDLSWEESND